MSDQTGDAPAQRSARIYLPTTRRSAPQRRKPDAGEPSVPVERRVPGRSTPRAELLREFDAMTHERRSRMAPALWPLLAPGPDDVFRWRVELSCGCRREQLTHSEQQPPHTLRHREPVYQLLLLAGELWCPHDDRDPSEAPYREVTERAISETITLPADPVDPPDYLADQPDVWQRIRHDEPHNHTRWTVTLSCGHQGIQTTDPDWEPTDPPHLVPQERLTQLRAELEQLDEPAGREWLEHMQRMLDKGWPRPTPELGCLPCLHARSIVAYQRLGPLVPRAKAPKPPAKQQSDRERLTKQLARLEQQAAAIRRKLDAEGPDTTP